MIKDLIDELMKKDNEQVADDEWKRRRMRDAFAGARGSLLRSTLRSR